MRDYLWLHHKKKAFDGVKSGFPCQCWPIYIVNNTEDKTQNLLWESEHLDGLHAGLDQDGPFRLEK